MRSGSVSQVLRWHSRFLAAVFQACAAHTRRDWPTVFNNHSTRIDNDRNPGDAMACTFVKAGELCGPALGSALISLFGFVREAWKTRPLEKQRCTSNRRKRKS